MDTNIDIIYIFPHTKYDNCATSYRILIYIYI